MFKENKNVPISITLKEIENRMKAVTFTAPSFKEYYLLSFTRDLYIPNNINLNTEDYTEISKRISKCYNQFKDLKDALHLKKSVKQHNNSGIMNIWSSLSLTVRQ